tara:strand:- start:145 stop:477 length:333 start_codon:yes stop_codon:yes gene_type:complete
MHTDGSFDGVNNTFNVSDNFTAYSGSNAHVTITPPVTMRTKPTLYSVANTGYFKYYNANANQVNVSGIALDGTTTRTALAIYIVGSFTAGQSLLVRAFDANAKLGFSAEL